VDPDGSVTLGFSYGSVYVADMTLDEVRQALTRHLATILREPAVSVSIAQVRGMQQIRGEHLVQPDGTITLGSYGSLNVTGLTLPQAKYAIEQFLAQYLLRPEISLTVTGYNSKVYYVVLDLAGLGQEVIRLPVTGNETVLDAIAQLNGLPPSCSKKRIWVSRPSPEENNCEQVLPVDWHAITQGGATATNYQLLPGDRVFVQADALVQVDNTVTKVLRPVGRVLGITLLGAQTVNTIEGKSGGGGGFSFFVGGP
jgi:polysaccharide export outer membrane protein